MGNSRKCKLGEKLVNGECIKVCTPKNTHDQCLRGAAIHNPKKFSITYFDPETDEGEEKTWNFSSWKEAEKWRKNLSETWDTPEDKISIKTGVVKNTKDQCLKDSNTPDLYLTMSTGRAQQTGQYGRTYGVIFQGQSMMATTLDKDKALIVLNEIAKESGRKQSQMMWDGDKGTFIWMSESPV